MVDDERVGIAACGGYAVNPANGVTSLTWCMVHRAHHGRGHLDRYDMRLALPTRPAT